MRNYLSILETSSGDYQTIDRYLAAAAAVTADDLLRVAQVYLDPQKAVVGFLEPTATSDQPVLPSAGLAGGNALMPVSQ